MLVYSLLSLGDCEKIMQLSFLVFIDKKPKKEKIILVDCLGLPR